jgi:hypothetical protein
VWSGSCGSSGGDIVRVERRKERVSSGLFPSSGDRAPYSKAARARAQNALKASSLSMRRVGSQKGRIAPIFRSRIGMLWRRECWARHCSRVRPFSWSRELPSGSAFSAAGMYSSPNIGILHLTVCITLTRHALKARVDLTLHFTPHLSAVSLSPLSHVPSMGCPSISSPESRRMQALREAPAALIYSAVL